MIGSRSLSCGAALRIPESRFPRSGHGLRLATGMPVVSPVAPADRPVSRSLRPVPRPASSDDQGHSRSSHTGRKSGSGTYSLCLHRAIENASIPHKRTAVLTGYLCGGRPHPILAPSKLAEPCPPTSAEEGPENVFYPLCLVGRPSSPKISTALLSSCRRRKMQ